MARSAGPDLHLLARRCCGGIRRPVPSWNAGSTEQSILTFVGAVTDQGSPDYVPPSEPIAVFDNDGTLWAEQRMLELLGYLRENGFKTFIVSGGGIDFMRP